MEENMQARISTAKAGFSRVGWTMVAMYVAQIVFITVATLVLKNMGKNIYTASEVFWGMTLVSTYVVGFPVGIVLLRKLPGDRGKQVSMGAKEFISILLMCFPMMYTGAFLGNILAEFLSGGKAQNALVSLAMDESPLKILMMVVLAPLFEEYVFRKLLIDRCAKYGEKTAVVFSGVVFGLFHMSLYQFFYAFALGMIFAYVYLKTRRLRYCVALHMVVNFIGSVLSVWVISQGDPEALSNLSLQTLSSGPEPGVLLYLGYSLLLMIAFVAGLVLLVLNRKQVKFSSAEEELPKEGRLKVIYGNAGMIVFIILCVICIAISMIPLT